MADCLAAEGCSGITPCTWTDVGAFMRQHSSGSGDGSLPAAPPTPAAPLLQQPGLWFLKHRHGVKGLSVYPYTSLPALLARLADIPPASRQAFLVQQGVAPPLLLRGRRKATLRAHVLVVLQHGDARRRQQQQQQQQQQQHTTLRAYVHEDVIVQEHAKPLHEEAAQHEGPAPQPCPAAPAAVAAPAESEDTCAGMVEESESAGEAAAVAADRGARRAARRTAAQAQADVAVHVSSRGCCHPKPYLLSQLPALLQHEPQQLQQQQQQHGQHEQPHKQQQAESTATGAAALQRELWGQICSVSAAAVAAATRQGLVPADADPAATLYHLFAFDFAVAAGAGDSSGGAAGAAASSTSAGQQQEQQHGQQQNPQGPSPKPRVLLLEAKSYPAVASGTMTAVDRSVYTRLIDDLLHLVVLPALPPLPGAGGAAPAPAPGGFHREL